MDIDEGYNKQRTRLRGIENKRKKPYELEYLDKQRKTNG